MICLADDSGLEIDILDKRPGIFSSRWAGPKGNFNTAIKKVFKKLNIKDKNWKNKKIKARFICVLSIHFLNGNQISKSGKIDGFISKNKKGKNGFGYDPIFIPIKKKIWQHLPFPAPATAGGEEEGQHRESTERAQGGHR